ncbi:MAG: DeoR/GlpR transcriptional regulator [Clostridia bacterium]|nr:DeoR/GlpR transcriptional regulator [Clostridia bacterium]
MSLYQREEEYIRLLSERDRSVKELSQILFISEPTVRRDVSAMKKKELVVCRRGLVSLSVKAPDKRIPLFVRDSEHTVEKDAIARKALSFVKDGDAVMLDASTTAFHLLPYLAKYHNVLVITNGIKTALESAALGIRTICTGGEITPESYSFVGTDAEGTLEQYNADVAFFSCRGIDENGLVTDNSILENSIRRIMIKNAKKAVLLCDQSKVGRRYLNTLCHTKELDAWVSD